jgi:hypothetical protein
MTNIVKFPAVTVRANPEEALEHAKGWNFEQVVIIGIVPEENGGTIIVTADNQNKTLYLEMSELLRVMYLNLKGWMRA